MKATRRVVSLMSVLAFLAVTGPALAAPVDSGFSGDSVMLVVDVSGSMVGTPISQAKTALTTTLGDIDSATAVGLRSYAGSCGDGGDLLVAVGLENRTELADAIGALVAGGGTPTPDALRAAVGDLPAQGNRKVVLVSDGASSCGAACIVAEELVASESVDFTVFTVGFNAPSSAAADLTCVADVTGGTYVEATDTETLRDAIAGAAGGGVKNLVVLGDSYSSGEGTYHYYNSTIDRNGWGGCHRSPDAWGEVLALASSHLDLVGFFACSGARIDNLLPASMGGYGQNGEASQIDQLDALIATGMEVDLVMFTISGNDMQFAKVLSQCRAFDCKNSYLKFYQRRADQHATRIRDEVIPAIRNVVGADTEIILVGYPRLLPDSMAETVGCGWLEPHEHTLLTGAGAALTVRQIWAAQDAGVRFLNSTDVFDGAELCSGSAVYLNPISTGFPSGAWTKEPEQAHPSVLGYGHWAVQIKQQLVAGGLIAG